MRKTLVLVKPLEKRVDYVSASVIIPYPVIAEKQQVGRVIKCGPDCEYLKPGDSIIYSRLSALSGDPLSSDNTPLDIVDERDVFCQILDD